MGRAGALCQCRERAPPNPPPRVIAARTQVGVTTTYDPAYVSLDYPGGDLPIDRSVCTDVIIRALRKAHNIGSGAKEENCLFSFQLTGHYRIPDQASP